MATKAQEGLAAVAVADLIPTPDNPRTIRKKDPALKDLADSIKQLGVLQPVLARPHPAKKGKYDLRAGARRHAAAQLAGIKTIPCIVRDLTDREALEVTVTENLQREDLHPLEEAKGVQALLDGGWEVQTIAAQIGKSEGWVYRRARLTALTDKWRKALSKEDSNFALWPATYLERIARMDGAVQNEVLEDLDDPLAIGEIESLTGLEVYLSAFLRDLSAAPWNLADQAILEKTPACSACSNRSSRKPFLFPDLDKTKNGNDRCLDPACWARKYGAFLKAKADELKKKHGDVVFVQDVYRTGDIPKDMAKKALSSYQVFGCKKSAKGAKPCLRISGKKVGTWFWGTTRRSESSTAQRAAKKKGASKRSDTEASEPEGDPDKRREVARDFANAHIAFTLALALEAECFDLLEVDGRFACEPLDACALWSLAGGGGTHGGRSGTAARLWLMSMLGVLPPEEQNLWADPAAPAELEKLNYDGLARCTEAIGVYDVLSTRTFAEIAAWEPTTALLVEAANTFEVSADMLDEHRKVDVLVIARELGVEVSKSKKLEDIKKAILEAGLPPGSLTKDLQDAFGVKRRK